MKKSEDTDSSGINTGKNAGTNREMSRGNRLAYFTLELIPDPFMVLKSDGTILDLNQGLADFIKTPKSELTGRRVSEVEALNIICGRSLESIKNTAAVFDVLPYHGRHIEVSILPFKAEDGTRLLRIMLKDLSDYINLEKTLLKRDRELTIINTLSSAFISSDNMDLAIEDLLSKLLLVTDFDTGWLMTSSEQSFALKTHKDLSAEFAEALGTGQLETLCRTVVRSKEPLYVPDAAEIARNDHLRKEGIVFLTAVPLVAHQKILGVLFLARRDEKGYAFNFDFASLFPLIGNHISMILEKIRLFQETKRLSITDGLTGLFNSRYFYKQLDAEIARSNRYGHSFSLILFDIDNFKIINDTYGHQAGDDVLLELARILQEASRVTDIVVRYGGEEFIIVLPNTSESDTLNLAERIRSSVEQRVFLPNLAPGITITLSGGIASFPLHASGVKTLLNAADMALYAAKAAGKNTVVCFKGRIND